MRKMKKIMNNRNISKTAYFQMPRKCGSVKTPIRIFAGRLKIGISTDAIAFATIVILYREIKTSFKPKK